MNLTAHLLLLPFLFHGWLAPAVTPAGQPPRPDDPPVDAMEPAAPFGPNATPDAPGPPATPDAAPPPVVAPPPPPESPAPEAIPEPPPLDFPAPRAAPAEPPLPLPPPPPPRARRYAEAGSSELSLAVGYSSVSGFLGGGGFRRFVVDGFAPGVEGSLQTGRGPTLGLLMGTLRVAPVQGSAAALVLTGRGGRVLLSSHEDGWGVGGSVGAILFFSANVGLELGYGVLWLRPGRFCADLTSCKIEGPELNLRVGF